MNNSFRSARNFNQPLGNWDVSKVTNFTGMFEHALSFDLGISDWKASSASRMWECFIMPMPLIRILDRGIHLPLRI